MSKPQLKETVKGCLGFLLHHLLLRSFHADGRIIWNIFLLDHMQLWVCDWTVPGYPCGLPWNCSAWIIHCKYYLTNTNPSSWKQVEDQPGFTSASLNVTVNLNKTPKPTRTENICSFSRAEKLSFPGLSCDFLNSFPIVGQTPPTLHLCVSAGSVQALFSLQNNVFNHKHFKCLYTVSFKTSDGIKWHQNHMRIETGKTF